jgi:hypothetical protein
VSTAASTNPIATLGNHSLGMRSVATKSPPRGRTRNGGVPANLRAYRSRW